MSIVEDAPEGAPGADAPPPVRVGEYRLEGAIASGGFGTVYAAKHVARGTPAAVKILHAELASSPSTVARFDREIMAIQRVRHPNVVEVREHGRLDDGRPYFVMERLTGRSLEEHLSARGRLPLDEVLAILEPLCQALDAAHAQAIVHRDVKPSNIFLADEGAAGGRPRVVLLDFGVAKLLDAEGPGLTSSRHVVGTVSCMAPEQILGKAVDARTDVYALGALAYRMLTGEPPFAARSLVAMQQMHLYAAARAPSAVAPVDPALNEPLLRALRKDAADRQPSAPAFLADLRAAAGRARGPSQRAALAVYVEARVDPDAMDAPDDRLLADLEGVLPRAAEALAPAGFGVAMETGTSLLLARALPDDPAGEAAARRAAIDAVIALSRALEARPGRHPGVGVRLSVHAAQAALSAEGGVRGGELMRLAWAPDVDETGALASAAALAGLDVGARPAGDFGGIAWLVLPA